MTSRLRTIGILAAIPASLLLASPAFAHPGHGGTGFVAGLVHPLTGIDHLAAMLLVGLWSGLAFAQHRLRLPAIMLGALLTGFVFGAQGGASAFPEVLIAATLALFAATLVFDIRLPAAAAGLLVAATGLAHGFAHGVEVPAGSDPRSFVLGFLLTSTALLAAGLGLARFAARMAPRRVAD